MEWGRDPSGRFLTALEWLRTRTAAVSEPALIRVGDSLEGWTSWAPVAGADPQSTLLVVRQCTMAGLGLALAGVLALGLLGMRGRSDRVRVSFLLGWLGLAGVALAWLPVSLRDLAWWPLLAGLTIALPWYLAWAGLYLPKNKSHTSYSSHASAVGAVLALVAVLLARTPGPAGAHDPPDARPEAVYLIAGEKPGEIDQTVLLTPGLLDRLRTMARPAPAPSQGVVLVSAVCEGKLIDGAAEVDAVFVAHALGEGPAKLELPLEGVQLVGDVLLDGARVHPVALAAPSVGYALAQCAAPAGTRSRCASVCHCLPAKRGSRRQASIICALCCRGWCRADCSSTSVPEPHPCKHWSSTAANAW